jgi:hypothetical protein
VPRERLSFRQRDLKAAMKAAKDAGVSVARYEVTKDGRIVIIPGEPVSPATNPDPDAEAQASREIVRNAEI